MKHYVITILNNEKSVKAADRCIKSGKNNGLDIVKHEAYTPSYGIDKLKNEKKINADPFYLTDFSRVDNCIAAFCSHFSLWEKCVELNEPITIFEHDAYVMDKVPNVVPVGCISFGEPSYGSWITPNTLGVNPLTSKKYLPGAHAYRVSPDGAMAFIEASRIAAAPTDVFININQFPWVEEYYPWPVRAIDTFSTIQRKEGCLAKHGYDPEKYVLEKTE